MKRRMLALLAFGVGALFLTATANSQPPGGKGEGKGGKGGPGGGGGRFEIGTVLPPFVKSELKLTADQEKAVAALEADVKEKLNKILTDDQKKSLENMRPRGGEGRGGPGGPGGKGGGRGGPGGGGGEKKPPMPPQ